MSAPASNEPIKEEVRKRFIAFLEEHKQRRTPERFAILDEIYSNREHFDVETLYLHMKQRNYSVSRATVYNTLDLLLEANLVTKHQFGKNLARYERSYGFRQHDHMICNVCNNILEFCDPRIQQIKTMMGGLLNFEVTEHSLHLFGQPRQDATGHCITCKRDLSIHITNQHNNSAKND